MSKRQCESSENRLPFLIFGSKFHGRAIEGRGCRGGGQHPAPNPGSHVTHWKAGIIQVQRVTTSFILRAAVPWRSRQGRSSHLGSGFSCRDSLDLDWSWLDLGKRLVKSSLLQGKAGDQRVAARGGGLGTGSDPEFCRAGGLFLERGVWGW